MSALDRFDRDFAEALADLAGPRTPDYIDDVLVRAVSRRQRPAWTFPERWLPMSVLTRRLPLFPALPARTVSLLLILLLLLAATIVGYSTSQLRIATAARARAERVAATMQERARLARAVHDGVLQVLALVQRRGAEIGGDAAELARLAGEQESALRTLIRSQDTLASDATEGTLDLASRLGRLAVRPTVHVATPGTPVNLPAATVAELVAVVAACLDNIARHVGADAPAWVLVEDFDDRVVVSVRDEGPGIPDGRLELAAAEGRLGVSQSIRGRIADLGGTAELSTGPGGTEWEVTVPR